MGLQVLHTRIATKTSRIDELIDPVLGACRAPKQILEDGFTADGGIIVAGVGRCRPFVLVAKAVPTSVTESMVSIVW